MIDSVPHRAEGSCDLSHLYIVETRLTSGLMDPRVPGRHRSIFDTHSKNKKNSKVPTCVSENTGSGFRLPVKLIQEMAYQN